MATQSEFEGAVAETLADIGYVNPNGRPVNRQDVKDILDIVGGQIQWVFNAEMPSINQMQKGAKPPALTVRGIGRFSVRFRKAKPKRMGRNPATGEQIEIGPKPASRKLVVAPTRQMKEELGVE